MTLELSQSRKLFEKAQKLIPGGVNSPVRSFSGVGRHPVYFAGASGSRVVDVDGNEYIDFCQSWGPLILGHAHPGVVEAVRRAAQDGLSYGACHRGEVTIAERILRAFPEFERVRLVNSGTEAVMTALRIARGATQRNLILKFEGCYHGHFDGMLVKAGSGLATHAISTSEGIPREIAATTLAAALDDPEYVENFFKKHGDDIAAVIIEPMPANNGLLVQRKDFLMFLRDMTRKYGALLIFDEVISGFRLHFGGYYSTVGITPDIITLGKIIGGGMPVGAVCGGAKEMDRLAPLGGVYQAGTLSGNPVSLAAGNATLEILEKVPPYDALDKTAGCLDAELEKSGLPHARARRVGSVVWFYFDQTALPRRASDISRLAMERFKHIYWGMMDRGFYLPPSPYEVLFLSTAHTENEVKDLAKGISAELGKIGS